MKSFSDEIKSIFIIMKDSGQKKTADSNFNLTDNG